MMILTVQKFVVLRVVTVLAACLVALLPATAAAQTPDSVAGRWSGRIVLPNGPLEIAVTLEQAAGGPAWSGSIDILAQGAKGLPLTGIAVDGRSVTFVITGPPGNPTFTGTMAGDGGTIAGTFTQNGVTLPFDLRRGDPPPPSRPQEPKPPFPYREEAVVYRNEEAGVGLAGTLTLPQGTGPFPAVLLISGSGAQDRDGTVFGHKPLLLLADALTRRGVAVLRVDDRGVGGSDRGTIAPTSADLAGDARAGVRFLLSRADIDRGHVGLIGHSEGGIIAPMVAADSPDVRFIVMLAGSGLRGAEAHLEQVAAVARSQGAPEAVIEWDLALRRPIYDLLIAEEDGKPDEARRQALVDSAAALPGMPPGAAQENVRTIFKAMSGRWFRYFLAYDPRPVLQRVTCPVLALIGERDVQVLPTRNLAAIREALTAGGNTDATVRELPGLNHMFQTTRPGTPPPPGEYAAIEETMAPEALAAIVDWVAGHAN